METQQQDVLQLMAEKRKWQTEMENKRRQLDDDRRALQHLKSKAVRERWLLDGPAGPEQDQVRKQLEQDEIKTRNLEDSISRLEQEMISLETITHTAVTSGSDPAHSGRQVGGATLPEEMGGATLSTHVGGATLPEQVGGATLSTHVGGATLPEQVGGATLSTQVLKAPAAVNVNKSPQVRRMTDDMKKAMYSVEITVERDRVTGETRVLSTNTRLPVDLSQQGVKVYEDEQKVVHEIHGEDGIHQLSSIEVEELIHKADEVSMVSQTVTTVTSLPTVEVQEELGFIEPVVPQAAAAVEITGLEAKVSGEPSVEEASAENPVTMVFMGYQNVEDEDETKRVLGVQGTVKAELVHIEDTNGEADPPPAPPASASVTTTLAAAPPPTATKPEMAAADNGNAVGDEPKETEGGTGGSTVRVAMDEKKKKQPCKCCTIM
ncbi:paralemmin 1a [Cololabis saira]|uniref:paralemmin 1a n=1 Tax=Cololabis saira TaxID=129043 RepID=UPI002AD4A64C|nr:paralemmin 1a [Cololabis saira]